MPFKEGQSGNPNGRPKGSKNKKKAEKKAKMEDIFNKAGGFNKIMTLISQIDDPKDQASLMLKAMEYFTPKQKAVDMTTTIEDNREELTPQEIEDRLKEMQEELKQFDDD